MNRFRYLLWICCACCTIIVSGQEVDSLVGEEVDRQVWFPFIQAFNNQDAAGFNALHSADVLRGGPWGLLIGEEYFARNISSYSRSKASGNKRNLALVFESRIDRPGICYHVGYYRIISWGTDGEASEFYGYFHVVLRKVDGIWKITQDWDTSELSGMPVSTEDFAQAAGNGIYE